MQSQVSRLQDEYALSLSGGCDFLRELTQMSAISRWGIPLVSICTGLVSFGPARAAEFRSGEDVVIKADETIADDLYVFGRHITIDGTVEGDVVAFGEQITINGTVKGHIMGAAQTVVVNGTSDGARIAGQVLKLAPKAKLDGDIVAAGYSLELEKESTVSGDAIYAGFQALFSGRIDHDLRAALANCRLAGSIGGDVDLDVGGNVNAPPQPVFGPPPPVGMPSVPGGLTIADSAVVEGDLTYQAQQEAKTDPAAKISGEVKHRKPATPVAKNRPAQKEKTTVLSTAFSRLRHVICVGLVGLSVLVFFPRASGAWADNIRNRPAASFFVGIVGLIAFIAILVLAAVAIILIAVLLGLASLTELVPMLIVGGGVGYVALIVGFWLLWAFLAEALAGMALGRMALRDESFTARIGALVVGIVIVSLVLSIPYIGPWLGFLVVLLGLGGFCLWLAGTSPSESFVPVTSPVPGKA
jgi:cytoskeletal protein CcmA (bactofilin family)